MVFLCFVLWKNTNLAGSRTVGFGATISSKMPRQLFLLGDGAELLLATVGLCFLSNCGLLACWLVGKSVAFRQEHFYNKYIACIACIAYIATNLIGIVANDKQQKSVCQGSGKVLRVERQHLFQQQRSKKTAKERNKKLIDRSIHSFILPTTVIIVQSTIHISQSTIHNSQSWIEEGWSKSRVPSSIRARQQPWAHSTTTIQDSSIPGI